MKTRQQPHYVTYALVRNDGVNHRVVETMEVAHAAARPLESALLAWNQALKNPDMEVWMKCTTYEKGLEA